MYRHCGIPGQGTWCPFTYCNNIGKEICYYNHFVYHVIVYTYHVIVGWSAANSFCCHLWQSEYDQSIGKIRVRSKIPFT